MNAKKKNSKPVNMVPDAKLWVCSENYILLATMSCIIKRMKKEILTEEYKKRSIIFDGHESFIRLHQFLKKIGKEHKPKLPK